MSILVIKEGNGKTTSLLVSENLARKYMNIWANDKQERLVSAGPDKVEYDDGSYCMIHNSPNSLINY